jgi:hypothetical protein
MKTSFVNLLLSLVLSAGMAHGATHVVTPGQSVQAAINGANSGDEIVIHQGTYSEDLSANGKGLTIRGNAGDQVEIDSLSFQNPAHAMIISNLRIMGDLNATKENLSIEGSVIWGNLHYDSAGQANRSLKLGNATVDGNLTANKANLTIKKSTINGNLSAPFRTDDASNELSAIVLQSTIGQKLTCRAAKSWVLYNEVRHSYFEGTVQIVGNHFNGNSLKGIGIDVNGSQTHAKIRNNRIHGFSTNSQGNIQDVCIGIRIIGTASADVLNNLIYNCYDAGGAGTENRVGMGIYVESTSGTTILGNALWACYVRDGLNQSIAGNRLVWAPYSKGVFRHNFLWRKSTQQGTIFHGGGVESVDNLSELSGNANVFVSISQEDFTPHASSALINAGPPDPQYNDRDGTRNDIGMFGGHNFFPNGKTTDKPIVIGLDVAPAFVPAGGTVTIESTGATVK